MRGFFIFGMLLLVLAACRSSPPQGEVSVRLKIGPDKTKAYTAPNAAAHFDCLVVNIVGPGINSADETRFPTTVYPSMRDDGEACFYPGTTSALIDLNSSSGVELNLTTRAGADRLVQVLGLDGVSCSTETLGNLIRQSTHPHQTYGALYELGRVRVDLSESRSVTIPNLYDSTDLKRANCYLPETATPVVEPVYPSASNWMDYWDAEADAACDAATSNTCYHGGEARQVVLSDYSSCLGLSAEDSLGAFDWVCREINGRATFQSLGLRPGRGISDVIDFDVSDFRPMRVEISLFERVIERTALTQWWSNGLADLAVGQTGIQTINTSGTIYHTDGSETEYVTDGFNITGDKVAVVIAEGDRLRHDDAATDRCDSAAGGVAAPDGSCLLTTAGADFLWFEGEFDGLDGSSTKIDNAFILRNIRFSRFHNLKIQSVQSNLIDLGGSQSNHFFNVRLADGGIGLVANDSDKNRFIFVLSSNTTSHGFRLENVSQDNFASNLQVNNTGTHAIRVAEGSLYTALAGVTVLHSDGRLLWNNDNADHTTLDSFVGAHSEFEGLQISSIANNKLNDFYLSNVGSGNGALRLANSTTTVSGLGYLGPSNSRNCNTGTGNNITDGASDICEAVNTDLEVFQLASNNNLFEGVVTSDSVNLSAGAIIGSGEIPFASVTDYLNFEDPFRTIGPFASTALFNAAHKTYCSVTYCAIWSWLPDVNDTAGPDGRPALLNRRSCPDSEDTATHTFSSGSVTYLKNTIELIGDLRGNENGLCESNEDCLFAPHLGAFQGVENLGPSNCPTLDGSGTIKNVRLFDRL